MTSEQKIDKILSEITDLKVKVSNSLIHQEYHHEKLKIHEDKIIVLEADRNKMIGKTAIISIVSGSLFGIIGTWLTKHF